MLVESRGLAAAVKDAISCTSQDLTPICLFVAEYVLSCTDEYEGSISEHWPQSCLPTLTMPFYAHDLYEIHTIRVLSLVHPPKSSSESEITLPPENQSEAALYGDLMGEIVHRDVRDGLVFPSLDDARAFFEPEVDSDDESGSELEGGRGKGGAAYFYVHLLNPEDGCVYRVPLQRLLHKVRSSNPQGSQPSGEMMMERSRLFAEAIKDRRRFTKANDRFCTIVRSFVARFARRAAAAAFHGLHVGSPNTQTNASTVSAEMKSVVAMLLEARRQVQTKWETKWGKRTFCATRVDDREDCQDPQNKPSKRPRLSTS